MRGRSSLFWLGLFGTLLLLESIASAAATLPTGDYCWAVTVRRNDKPGSGEFAAKMHLAKVDSSVGTVFGYASVAGDNPCIFSGTYSQVGNSIYMNLVSTQNHKGSEAAWKDSGVMQVILSASTLNGSLYAISHDYDTDTNEFSGEYTTGTLERKDLNYCD